ncbi:hypothetical protein ACQJBY_008036 [Aegilops geniculata]
MSRHHHHDPAPPPCCSCCACACGCSPPAPAPAPCGYYAVPPPQPAPGSDQLLHAIAAHLLLSSAPPPPPQPQAQPPPQPQPQPQHQPQPHPQPPPNPAAHHANLYASYAYQYQHQQQPGSASAPHAAYPQPPAAAPAPPPQQPNPPDHGQLLLHSLLRRVAALETTLPHVLPSHPAQPHQQPNPRRHHRAGAHQEDSRSPSPPPRRARRGQQPPTERELAARTIQAHFRRFLARRSRTLRQLKELAMLRSKAASLRAALSGSGSGRRRCKDPMAVSEAVLGMLYRLDGIQGGDPMIREGKHAVSRELGRILEFVDKVLLKEQEEMGVDGAFDDYPEGCHGMNRPTVNRKVSFRGNEATNEADGSSESLSSADADETKAANSKKSSNGKPGLAAPVPVHMESRRTGGEM